MSATAALLQGSVLGSAFGGGSSFPGFTNDQNLLYVYFKVTAAGAYAALGDPLDLTALGDVIKSPYLPLWVEIQSQKSGGLSGFVYGYVPGTTLANGKFQVLTSNGAAPNPLLDLGAGAYPAGVTGDTIIGIAAFIRA